MSEPIKALLGMTFQKYQWLDEFLWEHVGKKILHAMVPILNSEATCEAGSNTLIPGGTCAWIDCQISNAPSNRFLTAGSRLASSSNSAQDNFG